MREAAAGQDTLSAEKLEGITVTKRRDEWKKAALVAPLQLHPRKHDGHGQTIWITLPCPSAVALVVNASKSVERGSGGREA